MPASAYDARSYISRKINGMPSLGKVYSYPNNPRLAKALIAAKYNGQEIDLVPIAMGVDNKTSEFLKKFPLGKIPAFEADDGFTLFESNAILYYAAASKADTTLFGKDLKEHSKVNQWIAVADSEFNSIAAAWLYPIFGYCEGSDAITAKAKSDSLRVLAVLDAYLLNNTFFVGNTITLADIALVSALIGFYRAVFDPEFRSSFRNVTRWFVTCINQPHFKTVFGDVVMCEKMQVAQKKVARVVEAAAIKQVSPPKAAPAKKEKPKKKKDDDEEEEDESYKDEKPKEKNPLDLLPSSKFVMDAWKRCYSNNETRPTAVNFFWENFDPAGYSIWKVGYKFNDELKMTFMSSNLIGGFFQRLESARKYAFGSMVVLGEDNKSVISGYFVFRGTDVPFEVRDCADYDSFSFTKADHTSAKDRELFNAYIAWDDVIEGRKYADGKIFK